MPALEVFGRRSRVVGSDDLYCPALFLMLYQLPLVLLCILYACLWRRCSSTSLDDSGLPFWYMLGASPLFLFRCCIYLMIMHVSAKGTIVDHERRVLMPRMLQVHTLWSVLLVAYGVAGVCCWYYRDMCHPDARFVLAIGAFLVAEVSFTFLLGLCILGDTQIEEALEQEKPLEDTLDPYGNAIDSERQSLLDDAERAVPSSDVYVPHSQRLWKHRCTRCYPHLNDMELTDRLKELTHFSQYAIGIYGWMLYVWSHPWTGTLRLAFSCLRRKLKWVHGDNWFHLGQTALQLETKVRSDDIVYASFRNSVYLPAFAVMLDHERREVVIAIRGTLSLEDCLTDVIAYGMSMDDVADRWGCDGAGEYAHQGFLTCAESIYLEINRLGILEMLFDEKSTSAIATDAVNPCERGAYHDYGLVLTGHSLGAGTAVLLSVMLRPKYPQLRCFAFSPPGCTMSPGLASRCAAFTYSVVVGDDIIARSSLTSAEELRDNVLDLIGRSKVNKAAILRQVIYWRNPDELLHKSHDEHSAFDDDGDSSYTTRVHSPFIAHLSNYRTMLQRIQESEPIHELSIPGRVIHLKRVVRAKGAAGCWVCCRPGGGGVCCTARTNYRFAWAAEGQFSKIRIGRTMLDDHFPDKVHFVLKDCVKRMDKQEAERL
ncbi:hypothetical protein BBO99_00004122 [Phytophthora kernoviae]|uniref:sn-1-specific diacylglycerol lipase n=2 Tax=Phytophthora kernoviae TaxID=325452 RepID=A0A421FAV2_9STRA|nr:hypothetical protein G195_006289 [Phytophthora kernoviae 00238/432]KAG2523373.1 hypothetical protein JM16_005368 [Phytophthora kernoviae]KAG2525186.1 hypothetical protein JM18_005025 [Phytophthora kernoviae]RLN36524.1 hypothetical protein BBI17_004298 [Phytophthora kernoviae]RLN80944.1 hypothetical protein BBO99_00004122 [Phytophthora kernoviae]